MSHQVRHRIASRPCPVRRAEPKPAVRSQIAGQELLRYRGGRRSLRRCVPAGMTGGNVVDYLAPTGRAMSSCTILNIHS